MNVHVDRSRAVAVATLSASATVGAGVALAGPQAAGGVAAAGVALGILRSPGVTLALYLLVPPFLKGLLQPLVPVDLTLVLGIACLLHVAHGMVASPIPAPRRAIVLWSALFGLVAFGCLYAPDQGLAFARAANWIALVFLPLLIVFWVAADEREVRRFVWTCLAIGLVVTLLAVLAFSPSQRLVLGFASTINTGRGSLMVPIIAFYFAFRVAPSWIRLPLLIAAPLTLVVSFAAGARGPLVLFVVLVIGLSVWHVVSGRGISRRAVAAATLAVAVLATIAVMTRMPAVSIDSFAHLGAYAAGEGTNGDLSLVSRLAAADLAVAIFEDHPALGAGTGAFATYSVVSPDTAHLENPHNIVLEIGADWGLAGLVLFGIMVLAAIHRRPKSPAWDAVWALFLFFLANGMLGSFFDYREFWGLLLLLMAAPAAARAWSPGVPVRAPGVGASTEAAAAAIQ